VFLATRKVRTEPGKKREYVEMWHSAIGARLKQQPGFITAWLLTSHNDDEVMVMSQWETEKAHHAWRTSDLYRQVHSHIGGLVRDRIGDKNYHIAAQVQKPRGE
jgi:heme-degrading monooxygenase HmoA